MPKISVIIPTYNCANYLPVALDSVLQQSFQDFEIIVIDDGSSDNTKSIVKKYMQAPEKMRYIYQENKGLACARNTGVKNSKGKYIAFLDADDIWLPDKLELQMLGFRSNPSAGLVHADIHHFYSNDRVFPSYRSTFSENSKFIRLHSGDVFTDFLCRKFFISCPTVIVKKECFDRVGLFDKNLARLGFEDFDMWLRMLHHYIAHYIHKPLALYRIRENSMSKNRAKMIAAHKYVITKLSNQLNLSTSLKKKAIASMMKEWNPGIVNVCISKVRKVFKAC